MKAARELGSERRETVRSLSVVGVWKIEGSHLQYERTEMAGPLVSQLGGHPQELGSYVQKGEALKASKREADLKKSFPTRENA